MHRFGGCADAAVYAEDQPDARLQQRVQRILLQTITFVDAMRDLNVTPHAAQQTMSRRSAIDERTTRHPGYEISQRARKRVEEIFGWLKTVGLMRKVRHRGTVRVDWMFVFACAVYNLVRLRNLQEATA